MGNCINPSADLMTALLRSGWHPGRCTSLTVEALAYRVHQKARDFLREFGELSIGAGDTKTLFTRAEDLNNLNCRNLAFPLIIPGSLALIGYCWYWCEGLLWMDEHGGIILSDEDQAAYISDNAIDALEILILRRKDIPQQNSRWRIERSDEI